MILFMTLDAIVMTYMTEANAESLNKGNQIKHKSSELVHLCLMLSSSL